MNRGSFGWRGANPPLLSQLFTIFANQNRFHLDILSDIYTELEKAGLLYELMSLKNVADHQFTSSEFLGEVGSILLKMDQKQVVNQSIGPLISEFVIYCNKQKIYPTPSPFYSIEKKEFAIDGKDFSDLKGFYNAIGKELVENNKWRKNRDAFNDILRGGFIKTEYGEPFKLIWKNANVSCANLEDFDYIINLIGEHSHIELILSSGMV